MRQLNQEQLAKLNSILKEEKLFIKFNELLEQAGAEGLQLVSFKVQTNSSLKKGNINSALNKELVGGHQTVPQEKYNMFPPICAHGKPMVEECNSRGTCRWVCDH